MASVGVTGGRALGAPPGVDPGFSGDFGFRDPFGTGQAQAQAMKIDLPQLQYPGRWNPRPDAMRELGIELRLRTRLEPVRDPSVVSATSPELFETPFLYVAGEGTLGSLAAGAESALRRFVDLGGMLVFDAADGGADVRFRNEVRALLTRLFPGSELSPVGEQHVLYRSFYIIPRPLGRTDNVDHLLGIQEEGRLKVLFVPIDLGGALSRNAEGLYRHQCTPGGPVQREWAIRMGINILLYATCTDYKSDRAHVETLEGNRRWR